MSDIDGESYADHIRVAREYLANAQSLGEVDLGHALFIMGAALKHTLDALEAHQHSYYTQAGLRGTWCITGPERATGAAEHEAYMKAQREKGKPL